MRWRDGIEREEKIEEEKDVEERRWKVNDECCCRRSPTESHATALWLSSSLAVELPHQAI